MPLKPAVSALARNTIKTAYDELDRTINLADKRDFPNTTLQHVREAALKIENQLAARQSLRNMRRLMPLFRGLEHYSKVVDILCNGTPYLPWVWAPITLILRIASEFVEAFEQIIKGYASIAESLKRFEILSDVFINEPDFQHTVAVFYADILKFHKHAYKFVRRSGWTLIFSASWGRFERRFGNILEDLKQHGTLIDLEANARDISQAKIMRDDIRKWREESENRIRQEDIEHNAKQYESIVSWLKVNDADQLAIMDSISSETAEYPGTCGWILKNKKVSSWADAKPDTPALWLKGSAGTGKSVLCTQLVNFLKGTKFVVCHFCTYLYASSTMYEQIVKSLLLQILRRDADLAAHVYKSCIMEKKSPTTTALEQLLQKLLASMSSEPNQAEYIWVVIDGLDECEPDKQLRLVRLINQLTSKPVVPGSTACKVLLSSRAPSTSLERLKRKQIVSLGEEKSFLNAAIRQYVDQRLKSMYIKLHQLNLQRAEIEEIQGTIVTKSDGMFLYARLVMDYLSSNIFFGGHEFKDSVNQLPRKLTDFYQRILSQILAPLDRRSEDRIRCILGWIAFAKRPLRKAELLSAITFSSGDPKVSDLVPEYIIDTTGTLIEERRDSTLAFIHNSVKDFLQTSSQNIIIRERQAFQEHGVATVTCLLSGLKTFDDAYPAHDRILRVAKGLHGFHVYATEFWTEYLFSCFSSNNTTTVDSSKSLISLSSELADELERTDSTITTDDSTMKPTDKRLEFLQQYPVLQKHVERALRARSLESLKSRILQDNNNQVKQQGSKTQPVSDKIGTLLASYQELVKFLLSQIYYPGLSSDELESFKAHFGTAAFTCRLTSCSYATIGFDTANLLMKHERTHIRWFQCTVPGCQYPPLTSNQALTNHRKKYHTPDITPRPILRHTSASNGSNLDHSRDLRGDSSANQPEEQQPGQQQLSPQQSGQNNASPDMQAVGGPRPNPLQAAQRQMPLNIPAYILQASPQEIAILRNRPQYAQFPEERLHNIVLGIKKTVWINQQQQQGPNEIMGHLRALEREEQQQLIQETMPDILMTPQEYRETATKLEKAVADMNKIGRSLRSWYGITRDDTRTTMFLRTRWRILEQFTENEKMFIAKDAFSIQAFEIDQAGVLFESMAQDLLFARNMNIAKQKAVRQAQDAQLTQPQQPMPQQG
ncbi:NACHT domain protein [Fusarium beomiforme]|uniref:NACHT domain protein n=1 Tax=Fusarium beomiforme TaxID=44412 RepID=A0A9P5AJT4_9HYPO|nr:NACHT domain protein [Fusarium beomiforme]